MYSHRVRTTIAAVTVCGIHYLFGVKIASAQQEEVSRPREQRLAHVVNVRMTSRSLRELLDELSLQTGLKIVPSDSVADRRITIFITNQPCISVLEAVTAMNGWNWRRQKPGSYIVERRRIASPVDRVNLPSALTDALPKDIRKFMRLDDWHAKRTETSSGVDVSSHVANVVQSSRQKLMHSVKDALRARGSLPYSQFSPDQKDWLILQTMFGRALYYLPVIYDDFGPHKMVPEKCVLEITMGNTMMVNMYVPEIRGRTGFGGAILP